MAVVVESRITEETQADKLRACGQSLMRGLKKSDQSVEDLLAEAERIVPYLFVLGRFILRELQYANFDFDSSRGRELLLAFRRRIERPGNYNYGLSEATALDEVMNELDY